MEAVNAPIRPELSLAHLTERDAANLLYGTGSSTILVTCTLVLRSLEARLAPGHDLLPSLWPNPVRFAALEDSVEAEIPSGRRYHPAVTLPARAP